MSAKVTPEQAAKRELRELRKQLQAEHPNDAERVDSEVELWRTRQEIRAERDQLAAEDEEVWAELSEEERDGWISLYLDLPTAKQQAGRTRRQDGGGSMFSGQRPSRVAPLRSSPRGGRGDAV
jgi:hypothetical protein